MKRILTLCVFFIIIQNSTAQVEQSGSFANQNFAPNFYIDFIRYESDFEGKVKVDVLIQVPYSSVQFQQTPKGYTAKYSISLTFFDSDKDKILFEKLWNEKIVSLDFLQTYSEENYYISHRSFDLLPEEYIVVCAVEDQNSKKPILFENNLTIKEFEKPVGMSNVMIIKNRLQTKEGESIIPNVSHSFKPTDNNISLYYEIYSDEKRIIMIHYVIEEINREKSSVQMQTAEIKRGRNIIYHDIKDYELPIGDYRLTIQIKNEDGDDFCSGGILFRSTLPGLPIALSGLDDAVDQMQWIASQDDIDFIDEAENYDVKLERFLAYWKSQDPDTNSPINEVMNEYYRRVKYANDNFKSYFDGWKSDMGMIYITLGPPNQVERQPMSIDTKPYEIWQYFDLNRQFIFLDESGFGHYRLTNPQYGEWNRYRQ